MSSALESAGDFFVSGGGGFRLVSWWGMSYSVLMKKILMVLIAVAVLPVVGQNEKVQPAHWGAAGKMPKRKDARPDAHQRMLEKYDSNKDGKLDAAERKAMQK